MREFAEGYFISKEGEVFSRWRKLKCEYNHNGYLRVKIRDKNYRVHRLVAEAYIPNPHAKPFVNHKNGNRQDNRVENLEWATHEENEEHKNTREIKYKNDSIRIIGVDLKSGKKRKFKAIEGVKFFGFTPSAVRGVLKGKASHHKGWMWYKEEGYASKKEGFAVETQTSE